VNEAATLLLEYGVLGIVNAVLVYGMSRLWKAKEAQQLEHQKQMREMMDLTIEKAEQWAAKNHELAERFTQVMELLRRPD